VNPTQEDDMQYALLIYVKPGSTDAFDESERRAITGEYMAIREEPGMVGGAQLQPIESATTVRIADGRTLTTDGPYADTKEVFGGFYLLEAEDLDRALAIAERIPAVRMGGAVEVRPLVEQPY
jgi:hypothetical protein